MILTERKYPIGAEVTDEGVSFRVWAPKVKKVEVVLEGNGTQSFPLEKEKDGYFSAVIPNLKTGTLYRFRLDGQKDLYPDPASGFQPEGPFGPSQVIDQNRYKWHDEHWQGVSIDNQVIYEMHIGTFTPEGTYAAAAEQLQELKDLGITILELMPLADFAGRFGWGYDGVNMFAPTRLYGSPHDLKKFIDSAHEAGLAVILDVVYNHFGPDGNFIRQFSCDYTQKEDTEWGAAINFTIPQVREFFVTNAKYWISEYHFDGLRLDATHAYICNTPVHIITEITKAVKEAAGKRKTIVVSENEPQKSFMAEPYSRGGYGVDALWNDDFHHTAIVRLTGKRNAYYQDYTGTPQEFISCFKYGFLYQGQYYYWQSQCRGDPGLYLNHSAFITFLENHDQVANSISGTRLHKKTDPANFRAMTALYLLSPGTPMLFQGQEFNSSKDFLYFADHKPELAKLVHDGRKEFLKQFPNAASEKGLNRVENPSAEETFIKSKLDFSDRIKNSGIYQMHKDLLKLRRTDPVLSQKNPDVDGAVLSHDAFLLRFFEENGEDRLMIVNFGVSFVYNPPADPLIAPPRGCEWELLWSSEELDYGGQGTPKMDTVKWLIYGRSTMLFRSKIKVQND